MTKIGYVTMTVCADRFLSRCLWRLIVWHITGYAIVM